METKPTTDSRLKYLDEWQKQVQKNPYTTLDMTRFTQNSEDAVPALKSKTLLQRLFPKWSYEYQAGQQIKAHIQQKNFKEALKVLNEGVQQGLNLEKSKGRLLLALAEHQQVNKILDPNTDLLKTAINSTDSRGNTALHLSVMKGDAEAVKILLTLAIDASLRNKEGKTAVQLRDFNPTDPTEKDPIVEALSTPEIMRASIQKKNTISRILPTTAAAASTLGGLITFTGLTLAAVTASDISQFGAAALLAIPGMIPLGFGIAAAGLLFTAGYVAWRYYQNRQFQKNKDTYLRAEVSRMTGCHPSSEANKYVLTRLDNSGKNPRFLSQQEKENIINEELFDKASQKNGTVEGFLIKGLNPNAILSGKEINLITYHALTPLHAAILSGNTDAVRALCKAGANVLEKNCVQYRDDSKTRYNALELANQVKASKGIKDILNDAIENKHPILTKSISETITSSKTVAQENKATLLSKAIEQKNLDQVKKLIGEKPDLGFTFPDTDSLYPGYTLVQAAVKGEGPALAGWLIEKGASPNSTFPKDDPLYPGYSLIQAAVAQEDWHLVSLLIKKNANLNTTFPKTDKNYPEYSLIQAAMAQGNLGLVQLLLKKNPNINATFPKDDHNYPGYSLIQAAVAQGNQELVRLLIENGANLNATFPTGTYYSGYTLIRAAEVQNNHDLIWLLEQATEKQKHKKKVTTQG